MDTITTGAMAHFGTFNGNPLAMAGLRAMDRLCTEEALAKAEAETAAKEAALRKAESEMKAKE